MSYEVNLNKWCLQSNCSFSCELREAAQDPVALDAYLHELATYVDEFRYNNEGVFTDLILSGEPTNIPGNPNSIENLSAVLCNMSIFGAFLPLWACGAEYVYDPIEPEPLG